MIPLSDKTNDSHLDEKVVPDSKVVFAIAPSKAAARWKWAYRSLTAIHRLQGRTKTTLVDQEWSTGAELYANKDNVISADAACRIVRNVLNVESGFADFACTSGDQGIRVPDFDRVASAIASRKGLGIDPTLREMFDAVAGRPFALFVSHRQFREALESAGIRVSDPRLQRVGQQLMAEDLLDELLIPMQFVELVTPIVHLLRRVLLGGTIVPNLREFAADLASLHDIVEPDHSGENADYIPVLRDADPERWGVAFCSIDGQRVAIGHVNDEFSIQSTSKPITYGLCLDKLGKAETTKWVGVEPSGRAFNSPQLLDDHRPFNPMVNAGAIMSASLLSSTLPATASADDVVDHVAECWSRMSNSKVTLSRETMESEKRTADNNFALAYIMRGKLGLPSPLEKSLDVYFSNCSLQITCDAMSVAAATLANGGVCPITNDRVFSPDTVRSMLSVMSSCGLYDGAGTFFHNTGLPGKSGVSGVILVVVPGLGGFATFSPRLNEVGNSARGVNFFERLVTNFAFHVFEPRGVFNGFKSSPGSKGDSTAYPGKQIRWAANLGDETMAQLHNVFVDTLLAVAYIVDEGLSDVEISHIQSTYAALLQGYISRRALKRNTRFSSASTKEEVTNILNAELLRLQSQMNTEAATLLFEGALLLVQKLEGSHETQVAILRNLSAHLGLSVETTEFLVVRWSKLKVSDVLEKRGIQLQPPMAPNMSIALAFAGQSAVSETSQGLQSTATLVAASWSSCNTQASRAAEMTFSHALWTDFTVDKLLKDADIPAQVVALMKLVDVAVATLASPLSSTNLKGALLSLQKGNMHQYEMIFGNFGYFQQSLFWAIEQCTPEARWSAQTKAGWKSLLDGMADIMSA